MIIDVLNRFEPDGDVLLRAISAQVTDEMLECISRDDYGFDADKHFGALKRFRDTFPLPENPVMIPMEVLELMRWDEPDADIRPGKTAEFGHWMVAFACAAILRVEHEPFNYKHNDGSTDSTTIQLILSLEALPVDLNRQAARFRLADTEIGTRRDERLDSRVRDGAALVRVTSQTSNTGRRFGRTCTVVGEACR